MTTDQGADHGPIPAPDQPDRGGIMAYWDETDVQWAIVVPGDLYYSMALIKATHYWNPDLRTWCSINDLLEEKPCC